MYIFAQVYIFVISSLLGRASLDIGLSDEHKLFKILEKWLQVLETISSLLVKGQKMVVYFFYYCILRKTTTFILEFSISICYYTY